jgi:hypothetical protein
LSWAGLIFFLSTRPASGLPAPWFLAHDKLVHAGVYGVLSLTVYFALRKGHHRTPCTAALMGTLFASLYGLERRSPPDVHPLPGGRPVGLGSRYRGRRVCFSPDFATLPP